MMECYSAIKRNELIIQIMNMQHQGLLSKASAERRESSQSQRLHYCMNPFMRYSGIELSGFGVRRSLTQGVLGGNGMTAYLHCGGMPEIYACMKTHRPVYHHHYQTLFIICKFTRYSSLVVLITRSTLVNKAGT